MAIWRWSIARSIPVTATWSSPSSTRSFVCRRLCRRGEELRLHATDAAVPDVVAAEGDAFDIWGVVTHVVKHVSRSEAPCSRWST